MKKLIPLALFGLFIYASCSNSAKETADAKAQRDSLSFYGDTISPEGAIDATELMDKMKGADSVHIKLTGKAIAVCQKKGCWMDMNIGGDKTMKVRFKNYAFFVPKDAGGKTVVIEGNAYKDTTSVADLKHYAEDAGKSKEEIAKITAPEINIGFEANGVVIKK